MKLENILKIFQKIFHSVFCISDDSFSLEPNFSKKENLFDLLSCPNLSGILGFQIPTLIWAFAIGDAFFYIVEVVKDGATN